MRLKSPNTGDLFNLQWESLSKFLERFFSENVDKYSGQEISKKLLTVSPFWHAILSPHPLFLMKYGLISSSRIPSGAVGRQGPKTRGVMDSQSQ